VREEKMEFKDPEIVDLNPRKKDGLQRLLQYLCGEAIAIGCQVSGKADCNDCQGCVNWKVLAPRLQLTSLTLENVNDILLLVDQFPLSRGFFDFFFAAGKNEISFEQFVQGIVRFEGFAILRFGNVRYAYRKLYSLSQANLADALGDWCLPSEARIEKFQNRCSPLPLPTKIDGDKTWLLGYIAKSFADRDLATFSAMSVLSKRSDESTLLPQFNSEQTALYRERKDFLQQNPSWRAYFSDLSLLEVQAQSLTESVKEARMKGRLNTSHYLASDIMDVYVATSMREKWEFEDVHNVVEEVIGHSVLKPLKLRYFDPTQSYLDNRVDKGLVEALMLKRAVCTLYMIQETDTFGKDSELATTLAQGKPVIAYVPEINVDDFVKVASARPLSFIRKRLAQLSSEEKLSSSQNSIVFGFLKNIADFQPLYHILGSEEANFLTDKKLEQQKAEMCKILAEGERRLSTSRAETLQKRHPLALQVELTSGVANGVLVVRSKEACSELLNRLLTNRCEFKFDRKRESGVTALIELSSDSPFRVVTHNSTVTNSFWSWYFNKREAN
jgi:hypothetical protein